jgi:enolase
LFAEHYKLEHLFVYAAESCLPHLFCFTPLTQQQLSQVVFAMDVASSEFLRDGKYDLDFKNPNNDGSQKLTGLELGNFYQELAKDFPFVSIEDPFDQVLYYSVTASCMQVFYQ